LWDKRYKYVIISNAKFKFWRGSASMAEKTLEKCITVGVYPGHPEGKEGFKLEYYLIESEMEYDDPENVRTVYGIEVVKRMDGGSMEYSRFEGIYTDKGRTRELIGKLASNTVTPVSLPYILDDLLGT